MASAKDSRGRRKYQGHIWRKYMRRGSKNFRETTKAAPPLVIELKAKSSSRWCGPDVSGCQCDDPESEADPDAGIIEPPSEQEDPEFLMVRDLKYHLQLVGPVVGMARRTDLCKCREIVGNFDYGLSSVDTMGNLCTEVEWWLQDEAAQNRYDGAHANWLKLLAVWDHLLSFHVEDLLDAGFESDVVKDFLDGCLLYEVGDRAHVKELLLAADTIAI
ncbi:unnamed protein product [Symbiodinium pilosum]|uniref:Uncharacterized protein n=1 Tax=Symbiodinium pilosum TaxID=2952 RepID=A0A812RYQ6_SYMPI|nr:unnamed protein product [Symbiodinium pilosum]